MKIAAIGLLCAVTAYGGVAISGAGSTFVAPIADEWCHRFEAAHPDVHITYDSVGSGEGIRRSIEGSVDFGATDGPMNRLELESYKSERHTEVIHVPVVIGAVVPAYNLPGNPALNFTPEALAGIYLGAITKWNAPELSKASPGVALPDSRITVVHRSDGSGTSYVWADYLEGQHSMEANRGCRYVGNLARGRRRQGQPGRRRHNREDALLDRV